MNESFTETLTENSSRASPSLPDVSRANFCGVRIHPLRLCAALQKIESFIEQGPPHQVCLCNAYTVTVAQADPEVRDITNRAALALPDGTSLVWFSRLIDVRIPERVAGPDLLEELCPIAERKGYRFFFLGSTSQVLTRLAETIRCRWPKLQVVGTYAPPVAPSFSDEENQRMIDQINAARPHILWLGLSSPKQDLWIGRNLSRLEVPVCIGIGAALNFLSGDIPRAPRWMRNNGWEWLYRLSREPRRLWKRYLFGNTKFLALVLRTGWLNRSQKRTLR